MNGMVMSDLFKKYILRSLVIATLLLVAAGACWAASGGDEVTWKATDWQKVLNFVVLVVALFLIIRKPVSNALNGRIAGIREELASLEEKKETTRKTLEEMNQKIAALDAEAEQIISEYERQGEAVKAKILENAKASAAKIEDQARRNIENEFAAAKMRLQSEILDKAVNRAELLVKEKITADDQNRLVDEYLDKVVLQ